MEALEEEVRMALVSIQPVRRMALRRRMVGSRPVDFCCWYLTGYGQGASHRRNMITVVTNKSAMPLAIERFAHHGRFSQFVVLSGASHVPSSYFM